MVPIEVKRMKTGDYQCGTNGSTLLIERKTLNDFAGSIVDGRLFTQVERMREFPKAAIVICGSKTELLKHSEINYNSILGAEAWLVSIGISVIREEDPKDAAYLILKLFEKILKVKMLVDMPPRKHKRKRKKVVPEALNTSSEAK